MTEKHNSHIQMIADYEGDIETLFDIEYTGELQILATRNLVVFPGVVCPILIGREQSLKLIKDMERNPNSIFGIFCQQRPDSDNPNMDDLYTTGVYAKVVKVIDMPVPGRQKTAIVQALGRDGILHPADPDQFRPPGKRSPKRPPHCHHGASGDSGTGSPVPAGASG